MGKIAFLFSGQGAQKVGMGKDIYDTYPVAKSCFDWMEEQTPNLRQICFEGPEEQLNQTIYTQPLLYTLEVAITKVLLENGIQPDVVAGFSLGELAALTIGGAISFETGFQLVSARANCMEEATKIEPSSMMAILKIQPEILMELLQSISGVYPANFNSDGQIVVSGDIQGLQILQEKVKEKQGRAVPLAVSGGFHSPYMDTARDSFSNIVQAQTFLPLNYPVYSNVTAEPYEDAQISSLLIKQMNHPVLWQKTVENMVKQGVTTVIEIGYGKTLLGLVKKIAPTIKGYSAIDVESVQHIVQTMRG